MFLITQFALLLGNFLNKCIVLRGQGLGDNGQGVECKILRKDFPVGTSSFTSSSFWKKYQSDKICLFVTKDITIISCVRLGGFGQ